MPTVPHTRLTSPLLDTSDNDFTFDLDKHDSPIDFGFDTHELDTKPGAMVGAQSPFIKSEPNEYFDLNQAMQYNQQQTFTQSGNMSINPASLSNGGYNQSMAASYNMGNSGIADDELLDLQIDGNQSNNFDFNTGMQNYLNVGQNSAQQFSHTPDGAPIQSPFTHNDFNYAHFRNMPSQQQQFMSARSLPQQVAFQRTSATPNTPGLTLQTPEMHSSMQRIVQHRSRPSLGGSDWEGTPSGHSWGESSPFPSPANGHQMQRQISEVLNQNQHKVASSLPTKMEPGLAQPAVQSQEAKRRRRRESHNMVERRRRDNINERIHDLGTLVPQHRLEDEKVKKHINNNAPLSPAITSVGGMSPPGSRRPTAGNITQGLPIEDKDKGPNKGDILNSSVAWTRDLLWYIKLKREQEEHLRKTLATMGHAWPFAQTEEEKRMDSELAEVLSKHVDTNMIDDYTRKPGSKLRVPGFTNVNGDSITGGDPAGSMDFNGSVSPGFNAQQNNNFSWNDNFNSAPEFKEEDEYDMEV